MSKKRLNHSPRIRRDLIIGRVKVGSLRASYVQVDPTWVTQAGHLPAATNNRGCDGPRAVPRMRCDVYSFGRAETVARRVQVQTLLIVSATGALESVLRCRSRCGSTSGDAGGGRVAVFLGWPADMQIVQLHSK